MNEFNLVPIMAGRRRGSTKDKFGHRFNEKCLKIDLENAKKVAWALARMHCVYDRAGILAAVSPSAIRTTISCRRDGQLAL